MGIKNVFKSWNLETFQSLLKYDKRKAYEYRKNILGHEIPDAYLTDAEKQKKGINIVESEKTEETIKKLDTPDEIMDAIDEDAFEPEDGSEDNVDNLESEDENLTDEEKATETEEISEDVETPSEDVTADDESEAKEEVATDTDVATKEEEPVEEVKKEFKRQDLLKLLQEAGIDFQGNASNKVLFALCEENNLF